jgi:hypothetical protein
MARLRRARLADPTRLQAAVVPVATPVVVVMPAVVVMRRW